ncbi:MAG: hypothetical protein QNJ14_02700 [Woeseiaceae bacterium]|nr:hypothetical protein [Woeseiaceae bacterium]
MRTLREIADEQQAARPPHDDPLTDRLLAEIVALAEEVCVLRDRLDTAERLAGNGSTVDAASIDAWQPSQEVIEKRLARHKQYFEDLFAKLAEFNVRP